jgi:maltose/maltodextrin transport system substrate-binding protein
VGVFTALINRSSPNGDLAQQFLEKYVLTLDGLKAMDAEAPLGVPALKALADEMAAKDHLIKVTYENSENGFVMPNIPQMGKFWGAMTAAFQIATNGGATPEVALKDARKSMER